MALYTISKTTLLPYTQAPAGLRIMVCTDVELLAAMGTTTEDDIRNRLANDHVAYVAYMNVQPAAFGWMARRTARIGELNHELLLPAGNRYLWNFRTMSRYRGLGIYPALLQFIIRSERKRAVRFWVIHAPENKSSLSGIIKAGFEYVGRLYTNAKGFASIENTNTANDYRPLLELMDITLSSETVASCWNCSSPFLKKREADCCCSKEGNECIGQNLELTVA